MHSYRHIVDMLPAFIEKLDTNEKFKLWDAMHAAYLLGTKDGAEEIQDAVQSRVNLVRSMAEE